MKGVEKLLEEIEEELDMIYRYKFDEETIGNNIYSIKNKIKKWRIENGTIR